MPCAANCNASPDSVEGTSVSDLSPLASLPLSALSITDTPVSDLVPLRDLPLRRLHLGGTVVSDLSPLRGMPLEELSADRCTKISDFAVLSEIRTLKKLRVSK